MKPNSRFRISVFNSKFPPLNSLKFRGAYQVDIFRSTVLMASQKPEQNLKMGDKGVIVHMLTVHLLSECLIKRK